MVNLTVTPLQKQYAEAYIEYFPLFCVSKNYAPDMDWPEIAHTVASDILLAPEGDNLQIANYREKAWANAVGLLLSNRELAEAA
jgi:hypothetical protein